MKTAIILHGMPSREEYYDTARPASSNCHFIPWIQKQLLLKDIVAQTPEMPMPYEPEYVAWKKVFEQCMPDEDTILIGHSCGAGFIVRYLSEENIQVGKVVLVAPWIDTEKLLTTDMFDFAIDPQITAKTAGITIFNSSDDMPEIHESVQKILGETQGIKLVEFQNRGHFCLEDMGTDAFPELLNECFLS